MIKKLSKMQIAESIKRYKDGETLTSISDSYKVSYQAIGGLLKRRGVMIRKPTETSRKYELNENVFDYADTEASAYWIGFLLADGNVSGNAVSLTLSSKDRNHLIKLKKFLESSHPIFDYETKGFPYSRLLFTNKHLALSLSKFGIVNKKTFNVSLPIQVNKEFWPDLIRGYVDGDGGFGFSKSSSSSPNVIFHVTSTKNMVLWMQSVLMKECGLSQTKLNQRNKQSPIYTLRYNGKKQVKRIGNYLYGDSEISLDRKKLFVDAL